MKLRRKTSYFGPRGWVSNPPQEEVKSTILVFFARWVSETAVISRFLAEALQTLQLTAPPEFVLPIEPYEYQNPAVPFKPLFRRTADYAFFLITSHPEWEFYERFCALHPGIRCIPLYPAERYSLWLPEAQRTLFPEGLLLGQAIVEKKKLSVPAVIVPFKNPNQKLTSPLTINSLEPKI